MGIANYLCFESKVAECMTSVGRSMQTNTRRQWDLLVVEEEKVSAPTANNNPATLASNGAKAVGARNNKMGCARTATSDLEIVDSDCANNAIWHNKAMRSFAKHV